ncbi:MAG: proton-conducting transporter membrane subunit [Oscillospiraceae bacterium]|nr:proton-conducting transporter membrane subunit [Oscillospiraceae bacterium]
MGKFLLAFLVFFPFAAALVGYLIGRHSKAGRDYFAQAAYLLEFLAAVGLSGCWGSTLQWDGFCGLGLSFACDGFRTVMAVLAGYAWLSTTVASREYFGHLRNRNRYYLFTLMTLGSTMGVFLAADLYTVFIFFEIMSFTSWVMVAQEETPEAQKASGTYLGMAVLGGLVTLMGLFMLYSSVGTLRLDELAGLVSQSENKPFLYTVGVLIFFGFAVKACIYPLHVWLPTAYLAAPAPATALLSSILSKAGVFGILAVSCNIFLHDTRWGNFLLVLAVLTMVTGALLAVFSINLKRTLACSSMSQLGFILTGIAMQCLLGPENALAAGGTILHLMNHTLIKIVLFLSAGVIFLNLESFDLNRIRGFGRKKPLLMTVFLMGVLAIAGVPLWSGYVSKTLLHESIVEYIAMAGLTAGQAVYYKAVEWLFLISGGLTVAYMTKLFVAVFVEKNPTEQARYDEKRRYVARPTAAVLTVTAAALPVLGILPGLTMDRIAGLCRGFMHAEAPAHAVHYFSLVNLKGAVVSLLIGAAVYLLLVRPLLTQKQPDGTRLYVNRWPRWLDLEYGLYRPILLRFLPFIGALLSRTACSLADWAAGAFGALLFWKAPKKVEPPVDNAFGVYPERPHYHTIRGSLAYSLLLFGIGLSIMLLYLLFVR